jgi:hypothetical protein
VRHPNEAQLAWYAGGELSGWERLRTRWHADRCADCARVVAEYAGDRAVVRELASAIPDAAAWAVLSREMEGNIRVGLAAGEAVGPESRITRWERPRSWRPLVAIGAGSLVLTFVWWINIPHDRSQRIWEAVRYGKPTAVDQAVTLEATSSGIEVKRGGQALLTVLHPDRKPSDWAVQTDGSLNARYVDESGQVTITHVAAQ